MPASTRAITRATHDRLRAELAELTGPRRDEIADALVIARQNGRIEENADYSAVKEEERLLEDRIRHIEDTLSGARILDQTPDSDTVTVGSTVTIVFDGDDADEAERYLVGDRAEQAAGIEVCSPSSPLGSALLGAAAGDLVAYQTPSGTTVKVQVTDVA